MFKTPSDLSTFLKLFSNCFHIQSNLVTLLQKPVLSDMHIQQEQARAKDCINNNYTSSAALTPNRTQSPIMRKNATTIGDFKLNEPVSNVKAITTNGNPTNNNNNNNNNNKNDLNSGGNDRDSYIPDFDVKMENLCEYNCPKVSLSSAASSLTQISTPSSPRSPAMSPVPPQSTTASERSAYAKNQSLKQRINSLVIKTLAENSEKDKHNTAINLHQTNSQTNSTNTSLSTTLSVNAPTNNVLKSSNSDHNSMFIGDTWKIKVLQFTRVIATVEDSKFVTDAITKSANTEQVVISVDCEGINLGIKGELTLVEIGTIHGEAFIFDVMQCPNIMTEGGLKALLENEKVIKIIHDCRNDSVNLFIQFKVLLRNVFDTQVSYSNIFK